MPQKKAPWFIAKHGNKPIKKSRKRIPSMSKKRQKTSRIYREMAKAFLIANGICQVTLCTKKATQVHHTRGRRGSNYLDMTTWMAVCPGCHESIHQYPQWAKEAGYLKSFHA